MASFAGNYLVFRVEFVLNNSIDGTGLEPEIDEIYSFSWTVQKGRTEKDT